MHAYINVILLHSQGTIHFLQHFLHTLSQFHYWLERRSANMPADNFRSTTKTQRCRTENRYRHNEALFASLPLIRSHRKEDVALEGGDRSLTATV